MGPCSPTVGVGQGGVSTAVSTRPFLALLDLGSNCFDWYTSCYPVDGTDVSELLAPED